MSSNDNRIKAVILAAGMGRRLQPLTDSIPKPLIEVNNKKIIINLLEALNKIAVQEVIIVVGYKGDNIVKILGNRFENIEIKYIKNTHYLSSGNLYSLYLAKSFLTKDTIVFDSDLFISYEILTAMISVKEGNVAAVAPFKSTMSGNVVLVSEKGLVEEFVDSQSEKFNSDITGYKTLNIYLLRKDFIEKILNPFFESKIEKARNAHFDEIILNSSKFREYPLFVANCEDLKWYEIDDFHDLKNASYVFSSKEEQYNIITSQHGSYWEYNVIDHCLLYNLYFPPKDFFATLRNSLEEIVKVYPATQDYSAKALSQYLNIPKENIVVSNGSSELIKVINQLFKRIIVPVPSFNEYEIIGKRNTLIRFELDNEFELDEDKFIAEIVKNKIQLAIIVNPNNPTSLVIQKDKILKILNAIKSKNCILLVDESFIDFVDDCQDVSLVDHLKNYTNLIVLKSIGKTYGVGGIRLGYLLSANKKHLKKIKEKLPIWNINGFAEYFLQLMGRYRKEYIDSCNRIRDDRDEFYEELLHLKQLKVYKPQANFIFCKLLGGNLNAKELSEKMFYKYNILIKECSGKSMSDANKYIRLSSRTPHENKKLISCLKNIFSQEN